MRGAQVVEGRPGVATTDLVSVAFIIPDKLPYTELSVEEMDHVYTMMGRLALGEASLLSSVIHVPANAELLANVLRTCSEMINDELTKLYGDDMTDPTNPGYPYDHPED